MCAERKRTILGRRGSSRGTAGTRRRAEVTPAPRRSRFGRRCAPLPLLSVSFFLFFHPIPQPFHFFPISLFLPEQPLRLRYVLFQSLPYTPASSSGENGVGGRSAIYSLIFLVEQIFLGSLFGEMEKTRGDENFPSRLRTS